MADRRMHRADEAMATLARERGRALTGYAYLLAGELRDAERLVEAALVATFVRGHHVDPGAAEGYVRQAIVTAYVDGHRRRRRWEAVRHLVARADADAAPERLSSEGVDLQVALRSLPAQQRACVVLRYHDDLTAPEIAERLGLGVAAVTRHLSLAVLRMEALVGPVARPATDDVVVVQTALTTPGQPS